MRWPASVLTSLDRATIREQVGKRYALLGSNEYVKSTFRRVLTKFSTHQVALTIDLTQVRAGALQIRDVLQTEPFPWEAPLVWIDGAEHLLGSMTFPDDFAASNHLVVLSSMEEASYCPASFVAIATDVKGGTLQDFIRWMMSQKGISADVDVIRFLAGEYKENLSDLEKLLDQVAIRIHPRLVLVQKDIDASSTEEWDSGEMVRALLEGDEKKALDAMRVALIEFHPKGIITILSRRVALLMQVGRAIQLSGGQVESIEGVKPWVLRQNAELVKTVPLGKIAKWGFILDKAYASLSRGREPHRWVLLNSILDLCRASAL